MFHNCTVFKSAKICVICGYESIFIGSGVGDEASAFDR